MIATFYAQFRGKNAGGRVIFFFFLISGFFLGRFTRVFLNLGKKNSDITKKNIMPHRLVFFIVRITPKKVAKTVKIGKNFDRCKKKIGHRSK